jgi:hypothetical protein
MPDIVPGAVTTREPVFEKISPAALFVDESYQRNLSERSVRLIRKIVARWDWRTFMPPVVVKVADDYHVIDGQHTAIAALTHPAIKEIPVMVVEADALADQARTFLGRNRDRITVTPCQLHAAAVIAGDEDALTVHQVCGRAGLRILKHPPGAGQFKAGDTLAVSTVSALVNRRGAMRARKILQVVGDARIAPVPAALIKAVEHLMTHADTAGQIDPGDLTTVIRAGHGVIEAEAKVFAATHGVALWKGAAATLLKRCKRGRRRAA